MVSQHQHGTLLHIDVSGNLGKQYLQLSDDIARLLVIQITVQLLMSTIDGDTFFSASFWIVLLYLILGIAAYHLLFKNLVDIV